jgi:ribose 5-phosphate isomerase B
LQWLFDHRGVKLRDAVIEQIVALGHEAHDLGTDDGSVKIDYPDKAREIGEAIRSGDAERGVLVCGSGVGASVAACKLAGFAPRSAMTRTQRTRASSTTT